MPELSYSYEHGMDLQDTVIHEDGTEYSNTHIDTSDLIIDRSDPETAADLARIHDEILAPTVQQVEFGGHQYNVEYTTLNRDVPTNKVMAMLVGWGGSFQNPVGEQEYAAIARAFPDTHIVAINFPGSEGSSNLPRGVARRLAKTGNYQEVGMLLAPVVDSVFANYEHRTLAGASVGARAAIGIASSLENGVDVLRVIEPVGTRDLGYLGIMAAFMKREGAHAAQIREQSPDTESAQAQQTNDTVKRLLRDQIKAVLRRSWYTLMVRLPRSMSRNRLEDDLLAAVDNVKDELTVTTAEHSELTDGAAVHRMLGNLATRRSLNSSQHPATIRHRVIAGKPHSYLIGVPQAQAQALSA